MPEMDGFQLAEAIKADPAIAAVALVLLPSFGKRGHGERGAAGGNRRLSAEAGAAIAALRLPDGGHGAIAE